MAPGQPVERTVDAHPDVTLHGTVESISAATGARFPLLRACGTATSCPC